MKIKVTFKQVGQGDSIILEWYRKDKPKFGIIDSCIYNSSNPVITHIAENNIESIDFILLTHPHTDHFSGMIGLLEYCENHSIIIQNFFHTCKYLKEYIDISLNSIVSKRKLVQLFELIKRLHHSKIIKNISVPSVTGYALNIGEHVDIQFLAPFETDHIKYLKSSNNFKNEEEPQNNPDANLLCTIIKINIDKGYILLTSDSYINSQIRAARNYLETEKKELLLGQGAHHGSKLNLHKSFWNRRNSKPNTPIVFSVGNNSYGHIHEDVIDFFNNSINYDIYSTDIQGALNKSSKKAIKISSILDSVSTKVLKNNVQDKLQGDKIFEF